MLLDLYWLYPCHCILSSFQLFYWKAIQGLPQLPCIRNSFNISVWESTLGCVEFYFFSLSAESRPLNLKIEHCMMNLLYKFMCQFLISILWINFGLRNQEEQLKLYAFQCSNKWWKKKRVNCDKKTFDWA